MNKIVLYVTNGCAACRIQKHNIEESLRFISKRIEFVTKDVADLKKKEKEDIRINDVPLTCFYVDDKLKFRHEGSYPTSVIDRWIDVYLT